MTTKYDSYTRQQLVEVLNKRDHERRLGLVWERNEIEHDHALNNDFVTLELDEKLSVGVAPYQDFLIEGDNFDALRYLNMAYKGKIKCIYIDPPYNTGEKDWIYNDHYVDKDDAFRHSMWLEFMFRRLTLAKDLLAQDGVIFVSIGEDEVANLTLLMDQVFPGMKVGTFVWRRRSGANDEKEWFVSVDHEYVLCYANPDFSFAGEVKNMKGYSNPDNDERGPWNNDNLVQGKGFKQRPDAFYPIHNPDTNVWYPCDPDNVWRFATKERLGQGKKIRSSPIEDIIAEQRVLWPKNNKTARYGSTEELLKALHDGEAPHNLRVYLQLDELKEQIQKGEAPEKLLANIPPIEFWVDKHIGYGKPRFKRFAKDLKRSEKPVSTWMLPNAMKKKDIEALGLEQDEVEMFKVGYTSEGTSLLSKMVGNKDFAFPKPMSLIKSLIKQSTDNKSGDIILDFFAGSGTTGHAVWELNQEDDGDRRFILVSSSEASEREPDKNVCRDVTRKRLHAAIEGYSWRTAKGLNEVEGIGGEFGYMKAVRTPFESLHEDIQHYQIWYALQQIHFSGVSPYEDKSCQCIETETLRLIYLINVEEATLTQLDALLQENKKQTIVYSWRPAIVKQHCMDEHLEIERIPAYLVDRFGGGAA